jgi:adenylate cyclase
MKLLATQMPDLKLRLLNRIVQRNRKQVSGTLSQEKNESHKMTVCKAVEDRICERIDLATRTDLTARQAIDALRLLLKIARRNGLPVDFSPAELSLLTRGLQLRSRDVTTWSPAGSRL